MMTERWGEATSGDREVRSRSPWYYALRRFKRNRAGMGGFGMFVILILVAVAAPLIAPFDPVQQNLTEALLPPSPDHLFGTDQFGRDILSRVVHGARISFWTGFVSVGIACLFGVPLGLLAGYFMGWTNMVVSRLTDIVLAFPSILLAMSIMTILGPSLTNAMIAVGISIAPQYIRLARGSTLTAKENEYVTAARAIGSSSLRILAIHILPNVLSPLVVLTSLEIGAAVLFTSGLSFLGLGARPPTPEWGAMLTEARVYMREAWWIPVFPGLAISFLVMASNLTGDGLRDALDPQGQVAKEQT